jgi:hypothetical protein
VDRLLGEFRFTSISQGLAPAAIGRPDAAADSAAAR